MLPPPLHAQAVSAYNEHVEATGALRKQLAGVEAEAKKIGASLKAMRKAAEGEVVACISEAVKKVEAVSAAADAHLKAGAAGAAKASLAAAKVQEIVNKYL